MRTGEILRLVRTPEGDGIPSQCTSQLHLLDIIEIEDLGSVPLEHQTENILIDLDQGLHKVGHVNELDLLEQLANCHVPVFGDTSYKLYAANHLEHSLEIVKFSDMSFTENENRKTKVSFKVNGRWHNYYSVTDRTFFGWTEPIAAG